MAGRSCLGAAWDAFWLFIVLAVAVPLVVLAPAYLVHRITRGSFEAAYDTAIGSWVAWLVGIGFLGSVAALVYRRASRQNPARRHGPGAAVPAATPHAGTATTPPPPPAADEVRRRMNADSVFARLTPTDDEARDPVADPQPGTAPTADRVPGVRERMNADPDFKDL